MSRSIVCVCSCIFILTACASTQKDASKSSDRREGDEVKSIQAMVEAVSGKDVSQTDLLKLQKQVENDQAIKSAVESIGEAVKGKNRSKYSPVTGKRYAPNVDVDPETGVPLKWVDEQ